MIHKLDIIEYKDGRKELLFETEDGQTFMRDATGRDVEVFADLGKEIYLSLFGELIKGE